MRGTGAAIHTQLRQRPRRHFRIVFRGQEGGPNGPAGHVDAYIRKRLLSEVTRFLSATVTNPCWLVGAESKPRMCRTSSALSRFRHWIRVMR